MKVKVAIIESLSSATVGEAFEDVKGVVDTYMDADLTNKEKHTAAFKQIEQMGLGLGKWIINIGIKLAVAWLKAKQSK